jgi:AcrR family transcriptional regulator
MKLIPEPCLSRRELRRNDRRDAIIAVAQAYFLEHGYAATTMSGIAATLGGSKATLWSYFPSKEALFEAVLDRATTSFREQLTPLLEAADDLETGLRSFAHRFLQKVTQPEAIALNRLVHAESARFHEIGEIFYERGPRTLIKLVGDFLERAMARGELRPADPIQAAKMLMALCVGNIHQQLVLGLIDVVTPAMIAGDADAAVDLILRGYGKR